MKNFKTQKKKTNIKSHYTIWPIIFVLVVYWGFSYISNLSDENLNRRNDVNYEKQLINKGYKYVDDLEYKREIVKTSHKYSLSKLNSIVGPQELAELIENYDDSYINYTSGEHNPNDNFHVEQKTLRANLNVHSQISNGYLSVSEILKQAVEYADIAASSHPDYPFIIAFTDINSVEQCKKVLDIVTKHPEKYKNLKIVLGIEIPTELQLQKAGKTKVSILALAINPFDKKYKEEFPKFGMFNSYEDKISDYDTISQLLNSTKHCLYGIARPLDDIEHVKISKYVYIDEILSYYTKHNKKNMNFVEAYYDPYIYSGSAYTVYLDREANYNEIYRIGSIKTYGESIFNPY